MAKIRGLKTWLKENGYTTEQMQAYWDELLELEHQKVKLFSRMGKNWDETNLSIVAELPTAKDKLLEYREKQEQARIRDEETRRNQQEAKLYYQEHFDEIMLDKIDKCEDLTEKELETLIYSNNVSDTYGENRRWSRTVTTIIKLIDRFFCIIWEQGLTENQDNDYSNQPYEVEKHTYEKTITVTEWRKLEV